MYGIDQNVVGNSAWPSVRSKFHSLSIRIDDLVVRPDGIGLVTNEISFPELRFLEEQIPRNMFLRTKTKALFLVMVKILTMHHMNLIRIIFNWIKIHETTQM